SAWRIPESGDKKRNNPEYTVARVEDGRELPVATWGDGFRWEVPCAEAASFQEKSGNAKSLVIKEWDCKDGKSKALLKWVN
ncbi:unnamed protein product, partial [Prorocentrum cordatum]